MYIDDPIGRTLGLPPLQTEIDFSRCIPFKSGIPASREKNPMFGRTHTKKSRRKMSLANKKRLAENRHTFGSEHTQRQLSEGRHPFSNKENQSKSGSKGGKSRSEAKLNHLRKLNQEMAKIKSTCPHCGKTGTASIMQRWHFDRCKHQHSLPRPHESNDA